MEPLNSVDRAYIQFHNQLKFLDKLPFMELNSDIPVNKESHFCHLSTTHYMSHIFRRENIIGYTGNLYDKPTVYFKYKDPITGNVHFAHITQSHDSGNPDKEGRALASSSNDYKYNNESDGYFKEYVGNSRIHKSRSLFVGVETLSPYEISILEDAISKFPYLKKDKRESAFSAIMYVHDEIRLDELKSDCYLQLERDISVWKQHQAKLRNLGVGGQQRITPPLQLQTPRSARREQRDKGHVNKPPTSARRH